MYNIYKEVKIEELGNSNTRCNVAYITGYTKKKDDLNSSDFITKNEGFEVEIIGSTGHTSSGGLYSSVNCYIRKDGHEWLTQIDISNIFSALKQSTLENGIFKEKFMFVKIGTSLCIFHEKMKEYAIAKKDTELRDKYNTAKKTKKRIPGTRYFTLTEDFTYLGKIYSFLLQNKTYMLNSTLSYSSTPIEYDLYIKTGCIKECTKEISTYSQLFENLKITDDSSFIIKEIDDRPARASEVLLDKDTDDDEMNEFLENIRKVKNDEVIEEAEKFLSYYGYEKDYFYYKMNILLGFATPDIPYDFTPEQKRIFEKLKIQLKLENVENDKE